MKKVAYIVPYFGKLPANFSIWLISCATNPTIDWIIITDDETYYEYPNNVKVIYCTFENLKKHIQSFYDFEVLINSPWHLSLFKPAYGEIFENELRGYDFWGHCDVDLLWGNIRKFITDDVLEKYERIGFQGHSLLYKNTIEVNSRYKTIIDGMLSYIDIFSGKSRWSFDENGMDEIYHFLGIDYYKEPTFAHLAKFEYSFYLKHQPEEYEYKNYRQVFEWYKGTLYRHYIADKQVFTEEFMYIHFFCRPMRYLEKVHTINSRYIIYPDCVKDFDGEISVELVKKLGSKTAIMYYITSIWANRKKLTLEKVLFNVKSMIRNKLGDRSAK